MIHLPVSVAGGIGCSITSKSNKGALSTAGVSAGSFGWTSMRAAIEHGEKF
jgi:hypothetical protein